MVDDPLAGQPRDERAAGEEESGSALEGGGLGVTEPQHLGRHVRGVQVQAGESADLGGVDGVTKRACLARGAPVEPDDGGRERLAVRVHGDEAIDL